MADEVAVVTYQGTDYPIFESGCVTYGRHTSRNIQIDDLFVSSYAGLFCVLDGTLKVRNDSHSHGLEIVDLSRNIETTIPRAGGEGGVPIDLIGGKFELHLPSDWQTIVLAADSSALPFRPEDAGTGEPDERTRTYRAVLLKDAGRDDLRLLAALCEPKLRSRGLGAPPTTAEIGWRLAGRPRPLITDGNRAEDASRRKAVERRLTKLRERLTELGANGLLMEEQGNRRSANLLDRLALDAYAHGWVLAADLALLPELTPGSAE